MKKIEKLSMKEKINLAMSEDTAVDALKVLSLSEDFVVRNYVAANINCPVEVLKGFIKERDALMGVASNPNTPTEVFTKILNLDNGAYRKFISCNPSTPIDILQVLCRSSDNEVKNNIISHPSCNIELLTLLADDEDKSIRCIIAASKNLTAELFVKFSIDESDEVRLAIARNKSTPVDILEILVVKENGDSIYNTAKRNLYDRKTNKEKSERIEKQVMDINLREPSEIDFI